MNVDSMDHQIPPSKRTTRSVTTRMTRSKSKSPSRFHSSASPTTSTMKLQQNTSISNIKTSIMEPKSILNDELLVPLTMFNQREAPTSDVGDTEIVKSTIDGGLLDLNDSKTKMKEGNESDSDLSSISSSLSGLDVSIPVTSKRAAFFDKIPQNRSKRTRARGDLDNPLLLQSELKQIKKKNNLKRPAASSSHHQAEEVVDIVTVIGLSDTNSIGGPAAVKRPVGRPRKDAKPKADQLSGQPNSVVVGGVRLPNNIIKNPLPVRPPAIAPDPCQDILDDMKILHGDLNPMEPTANTNAEVAGGNAEIPGTECSKLLPTRKPEMDVKRNMYRRHTSIVKPLSIQSQSMRHFLANLQPPSPTRFSQDMDGLRATGDSDNHCSSCLLGGYLVCCETCPRVFHVGCMNPPISKVPNGVWECAKCRPRQQLFPEVFATKVIDETTGECINLGKTLWKPLFDAMNKTNPRVFELPRSFREMFEGVLTHPHSGAYLDATEREIMEEDGRMRRKDKRQRMLGVVESNHKGVSSEPEFHVCYRCRKTDMKLPSSQFLSSRADIFTRLSHNSGETLVVSDCVRSNMLKCDFCDLYWHYDCLDPPLADAPPRNLEKIDLNLIKELRKCSWGAADVNDWEWNEFIDIGRPRRRGHDDILPPGSGDEKVNRASPVPGFNLGTVFIRRKWMCPCHADWLRPKRRKKKTWGWVEVEEAEALQMPLSRNSDDVNDRVNSVSSNHFTPNIDLCLNEDNAGLTSNSNIPEKHESISHADTAGQYNSSTYGISNLLPSPAPQPSSINLAIPDDELATIKVTEDPKANLDRRSSSTGDVFSDEDTLSDVETSDDDDTTHTRKQESVFPIQPQQKRRGRPPKNNGPSSFVVSRMNGTKPSPARVGTDRPAKFVARISHRDVIGRTNDSKNDGDIEVKDDDVPVLQHIPQIAKTKSKEMKVKIEQELELHGFKHCVPTKRVKMDFLDKCRSLRALMVGGASNGPGDSGVIGEESKAVERIASTVPPVAEAWSRSRAFDQLHTQGRENSLIDSAVSYLAMGSLLRSLMVEQNNN